MKLRYTPTLSDLQDAAVSSRSNKESRFVRISMPILAVVMIVTGIAAWASHEFDVSGCFIACALLTLFRNKIFARILAWKVKKDFQQDPQLFNKEIEIEITQEKLTIEHGAGVGTYQLDKLYGFHNRGNAIRVYLAKDKPFYIPKRAFADSAAAAECLRLLAAAGLKEI